MTWNISCQDCHSEDFHALVGSTGIYYLYCSSNHLVMVVPKNAAGVEKFCIEPH